MFEATLNKASTLKKLIDAIKDLVTDGNIEVSETGMNLQAMDSSHVSLVALLLRADGFDHFRCDRNISLGINLSSMSKVLKCCNNDDIVTLKAEDNADAMTFMFGAGHRSILSRLLRPAPLPPARAHRPSAHRRRLHSRREPVAGPHLGLRAEADGH